MSEFCPKAVKTRPFQFVLVNLIKPQIKTNERRFVALYLRLYAYRIRINK